jgi:hypothetical protein
MNGSSKTKFKLFFAWQDDKEELWLRQQALEGWHLTALGLPGFYHFTQGEPQDVIYRLDFTSSKVDFAEYKQLFCDAGWEHVGSMSSWQYFRKPAQTKGADEIYTDPESKIEKYRRLLGVLIIFTPIMIALVTRIGDKGQSTLYQVVDLFSGLLFLLFCYAVIRILLRIRELRRL